MRKFLSFAAVLALLSGCAQSDGVNDRLPITVDTPETLYAEFDNERGENEDETRTYVEDEWMLRWHEGDEISFFPVTYNMCYRFNGQTGDNGGTFSKLTTDIVTGNELPTRYAVYPYREDTKISDEGHITYYFPEEQQWAEKSFGRGANVMVAATENHDDNVLRFKNVGGYLKLQIYSSEQRWLDYLVLEGNNGERIAGEARIEAYYDGEPWVEMTENASTRITYDCVDTQHWVDLTISTDAENPTDLWIVLPPTYFDNGITVRIYDTEGNVCTKSTNNWIPIDRNYVQPLSTFEFVADGDSGGEEDAQIKIYGDVSATGWMNCNAWIWDDGGANYTGGSWPGLALEAEEVDGKMYYAFEVAPEMVGSTVNVIFNNGSEQTVDINGVELNDDVFITLTEMDASGKWLATVAYGAGEDEPVAPEGEVPYNQIWYTTTDESLLVPNNDDFGGAAVVSNTYENGLGVITFDRNIYRVGDGTFSDKHNLLTINLPNCVTNLAAWTFAACSNLREFVIPTSIEDLGAYTFSSCHSLQSVTFPEHTFYYGFCIFEECENISAFYGGGVLSDNRCYAPNGYAEFIATAGITEYAFPDEVIGVGQFAFDMPNNIEVLIINDNLEWFGCNLRFCDDLREFRGAHTTEDGYALIIADVLYSVVPNGISEYTVPDGVRVIGDMAFMCHENITKITLPESVREIDGFYGCSNLEGINIPAGVTRICSQSFEGCELLSSIELPVGLTTIEHGTFNGCTGLTEIVIPRKVSRIDEYAFYNCTNLVSVRLECVTPPELQIDWTGEAWPFDNNAPGRIIYVPNQSVDAYMAAEGWSNYAYSIVGYEYDEPVIPVNPENCEWANVYLSLPTEEDAANGFYPYQNIHITIEGTDIVAGRIALVYADDTSVEDTLTNWGQSLDASWLETINSGSVLSLVAQAGPSLECRVVTELTNVNGDVVRFDQYITTDPLPEVHPSMDQWVGTWSLSAEQMINWTYADGAYNGPTLVDGAVTRDITIEAATDIAYDCVRVYGLTSLTTSNGEPIPAFATVANRDLLFQSGTLSIEQINDEEFTYWLPYVQTSNGVEAIPATPFTWHVALSEDGLTATTYFMGTVYYEDESRSSLGMDVFAYNFNTGAVRPIYDPETMPEVITPAGNITMTRTSSAATASYAPAKRAATRNMVQIELVK